MCYAKSSLRKLLQIRPNTGPLPLGSWKKNDYFKQSDFRRPSSKREKEKENKQTNKLEVNSEWFNGKKKNSHISATNYQ